MSAAHLHPDGVKLTLDGAGLRTISLCVWPTQAAQKRRLEFFTRWGMIPDAVTRKYAEQFWQKKTFYYINDEARAYRAEGGSSIAESVEVAATAHQDETDPGRVTLPWKLMEKTESGTLFGYEITRLQAPATEEEEREVVGFTPEDTFTDVISGINNRVVGYEVRGINWCMMPTKAYVAADDRVP